MSETKKSSKSPPQPEPSEEITADDPGVKWCEYGQHYLPADTVNFGSNSHSPDGLASWCRPCSRDYDRKRQKDHQDQKKRRKAARKETKQKRDMAKQVAGIGSEAKAGRVIPHISEVMEAYWKEFPPADFGKKWAEETRESSGMVFQRTADSVMRATAQTQPSGTDSTDDMTEEDIERLICETLEVPHEEMAGPEYPDEEASDEKNEDDDGEISSAS